MTDRDKSLLRHENKWRQGVLSELLPKEQQSEVRRLLCGIGGQVWDKEELERDFIVGESLGDVLQVRRREDSACGYVQIHSSQELFYDFRFHRDKKVDDE
jgi:hypothetical protein